MDRFDTPPPRPTHPPPRSPAPPSAAASPRLSADRRPASPRVSTASEDFRRGASRPGLMREDSCWGTIRGGDAGGGGRGGHEKKTIVLCFDGTGNKFKGNDGDTNILKIFSMLDRRRGNQYHYYQPGIGTYLTSAAMTHKTAKGLRERFKSAYHKAVDAAVGTSFDQHVMGGYKFLVRYYHPGDDIYMFGFSRGAYTARFLCEMLDHVGLVMQGNEEMVHFAWKTFSEWQMRAADHSPEKKREMYEYMKSFRQTFTRPVKRVRFLGLFDTVNSVPRFENAWLRRGSRFPYTARSTARVIRHAVGLDERRAKFRLDLVEKVDIATVGGLVDETRNKEEGEPAPPTRKQRARSWTVDRATSSAAGRPRPGARRANGGTSNTNTKSTSSNNAGPMRRMSTRITRIVRRNTPPSTLAPPSANGPNNNNGGDDAADDVSGASILSLNIHFDREDGDTDADDDAPQDVQEVWFPGAHGDIGGGWDLAPGEPSLAFGPLVWMVREARRAGLAFDEKRLKEMGCYCALSADEAVEDDVVAPDSAVDMHQQQQNPTIEVSGVTPPARAPADDKFFATESTTTTTTTATAGGGGDDLSIEKLPAPYDPSRPVIHITTHAHPPPKPGRKKSDVDAATEQRLLASYTQGKIHCCLTFGGGLPPLATLGWKLMEYLPFRRMDLQPDGSWKSITWPLPRGEVRDVPDNVKVHCSVLRRMEADPTYRPGNLLVGGGGRGVRVAPREAGMGVWRVEREGGSVVGEVVVKRRGMIVARKKSW